MKISYFFRTLGQSEMDFKRRGKGLPFFGKRTLIFILALLRHQVSIKKSQDTVARILFNCQSTKLIKGCKEKGCLIESP